MNFDNLNELPGWSDDLFDDDDLRSADDLAHEAACKDLYNRWNVVMIMLKGLLEPVRNEAAEEAMFFEHNKEMILGDGFTVGAKLRGAAVLQFYVSRMESAAIIRQYAQSIHSFVVSTMMEGSVDQEHGEAVLNELALFKSAYRHWVETFTRDELEDEWGLFN